jgi:hypothetical protein
MAGYGSKKSGYCPEPISAYTPEKEVVKDFDENERSMEGTIDKFFGQPTKDRMKPNVAGDIGEYGK